MNKNVLAQAIKVTMPVFFGYISIGIPFGLLVVNAGYPWWLSPLMGLAMFTGAGQFFAIALFSTGTVLSVIVLAEFLLSIRHIFYGLSLIDRYKNYIRRRPYLMYSITDETFALVTTVDVPSGVDAGKFYNLISFLDQSYWIISVTLGSILGGTLSSYSRGVEFVMTAMFTVIFLKEMDKKSSRIPGLIGILATALSLVIFGKSVFLIPSMVLILIFLFVFRASIERREDL